MTANTIRYITAGMALAGGILAVGDTIKAMPGLPGWLTSAWPLVLVAATIFRNVATILITPANSSTNNPNQAPTVPK